MPPIIIKRVAPRARSFSFSLVLWMFGFFTTVLLIGLWGRSVATDSVTLEESAKAVLESELVNQRVTEWLTEGLSAVTTAAPADIAEAARVIAASPIVGDVIDELVDQAVTAALAPAGSESSIELTTTLDALVPVVVQVLDDQGVEADAQAVRAAILSAPDLVLTNDDQRFVTSSVKGAAGFLTRVFLVGLVAMLGSGAAAVGMSDDRTRQVRELAVRLAVSAGSFALMLRISGWAVDPRGGRSPVAEGGAVLLASNSHVLLYFALAAMVLAAVATIVIIRRKRSPGPAATAPDSDDVTGEFPVLAATGV